MTDSQEIASTPPGSHRLAALDWMRGVIMMLMAVDHASGEFNRGRIARDSAWMSGQGTVSDSSQFITRWISHLCAPGFLFLAGAGLAFMVSHRQRLGDTERDIDRHLLLRGLVIATLDLVLISPLLGEGGIILQVLYAIGAGFILMIPLRRVPAPALVALGLLILGASEAVLSGTGSLRSWSPDWWIGATLGVAWYGSSGGGPNVLVLYPILPWFAMLLLGWGFASHLLEHRIRPCGLLQSQWLLVVSGVASLGLFVLLRGIDGYGNMGFHRVDSSWIAWLRVSKYPPSLSFAALELGLLGLLLAGLLRLEAALSRPPRRGNPLLVFGQTPLFFYVLHLPLLALAAWLLQLRRTGGLVETYAAALGVCFLLYPVCRWYRRYKAARPNGWTRYL